MSAKLSSFLRRLVFLGLLLSVTAAHADVKSDLARLEALQILAEQDNQAALRQLKEFYAQFNKDTDYMVRIDTLRELVSAYRDAGDTKESDAAKAEILKLATLAKDRETVALDRLNEVFKLRNTGKYDLALGILDEVAAVLKGSDRPENLMRLEVAYGHTYAVASKFEQALTHHLTALRLTDQLAQHKDLYKIRRMDTLAALYLTMQNPEQSLIVTSEALRLASQVNSSRIIAGLRMSQAMALSDLKRYPESLVAYERSLQAAQDANLPKLEALILSNIADLHLRTNNFTKAESVSRLALQKAEFIRDEPAINNAKANIGFALGGQGKIAHAMEYLNGVIKTSRDSGDKADIEITVGEVSRMYERANMYKEALEYTREQQKLNDELFRAERAKAVATLQEQFDADQRKKQIELLARENQIKDADIKNARLQQIVTLLGSVMTLMVGVFVYMLYRKVKQTNSQLEEANQELEFHSIRDPLTGLHNRRSFLELMSVRSGGIENGIEYERREDDSDSPDCLMILDIDHFKHINDAWGHAAGDTVLVEVAKRLRDAVRDTDMAMRWGGEEFLVYSPKTKPGQLVPMVNRILQAIGGTPIRVGHSAMQVTVSAGFISLPFSGLPEKICDWEKAMQLADMAMYLGKVNGRNRGYGLLKLLVPHEIALPELERDFAEAIEKHMLEIVVVHGPEREVKSTA